MSTDDDKAKESERLMRKLKEELAKPGKPQQVGQPDKWADAPGRPLIEEHEKELAKGKPPNRVAQPDRWADAPSPRISPPADEDDAAKKP